MSGAPPVVLGVERSLDRLGGEWDPLFAAGAGLQTSREWFAASAEAALPPGAAPRFVTVSGHDGPLALFPMLAASDGQWGSLTTPYTCLYQPLLRPDASPDLLHAAVTSFARYCRRWPITRLEALDPDWLGLPVLRAGFQAAGMVPRTFAHFANWHATVPAGSWDSYLKSRPGALRETIRRKMRAAERAGNIRVDIARSAPHLTGALDAYEAVYARSWKEKEPFPRFNGTLARALADAGALRIAVMWRADTPIAAQYWTVVGCCATVLKLAHDEEFKALSPGTVLTATAIRDLIETDGIRDLDFGRGDDPYKRSWTGQRRLRIGMLGLNVRTVTGLQGLAKHDAGRVWRTTRICWTNARRWGIKVLSPKEDAP